MRIDQPYYLLLILLIPIAVWIFRRFTVWQKKVLSKWANASIAEKIFIGISKLRPVTKFVMLATALGFIALGLSNLQLPSSASEIERHGVDVAIAIDVSNSMLSQDVSPSRLEQAKQIASGILKGSADNRVSLIAFAETAITMVPLTPDHSAAEMILNSISNKTIPDQGSDLGNAIRESIRSLPENQNHYRAIVLITDGEDQDAQIEDALDLATKFSTVIFTVGVGTTKGSDIPIAASDGSVIPKKDSKGQVVITKLNPKLLTEIATKTGGNYLDSQRGIGGIASILLKQIAAVGANEYNQKILSGYSSQFQYLLFPALLLLLIELFIRNKKGRWNF